MQFIRWDGASAQSPATGKTRVKFRSGAESDLADPTKISWAHRGSVFDIVGFYVAEPPAVTRAQIFEAWNRFAPRFSSHGTPDSNYPHGYNVQTHLSHVMNFLFVQAGVHIEGDARWVRLDEVRHALQLARSFLLGLDESIPSTPARWDALHAVSETLLAKGEV